MKHRLQYINLPLPAHLDETERESERSQSKRWWLIVGIVLLSVLFIGTAMWGAL